MSELPILKYKNEIKKVLKKNKLIIIKGETGCGKTTQVPQIINEKFFDKEGKRKKKKKNPNNNKENKSINEKDGSITNKSGYNKRKKKKMLISLPRRVATITVAERVSKEMNRGDIGSYVGYAIRFKNVCSKETRIKFVTDGILIREIMNDPLLKKYKFIILDEIHERSIRTDVLLGYTKILLEKRKKLKIILMSATFDINTFNTFFDNPPIISIPHKIHKITIFYPKKCIEDYLLSIVCTILQIHFGNAHIKHEGNTYYTEVENCENEMLVNQSVQDKYVKSNEQNNIITKGYANMDIVDCEYKKLNFNKDIDKKKKKKNCIGDILVFLPGQEEIEMVNIMLKEKLKIIYKGALLKKLINTENKNQDNNDVLSKINSTFNSESQTVDDICFHFGNTEVIPDKIYTMKILQLYSSLPNKKQRIIFDPVPPNTRKVILSTNVAETSVTIPNIKYVIDSGKVKIKFFDAKKGSSVLKITQISKDSAIQRSGRAGREAPGQVYRMYTKEEYENMNPFLIPEIFRTDLTQIYLELKAMNINNPLEFNFPENPKKEFLLQSAKMLLKINAIDVDNNLTELGKKLCLLPLSPIYANILLCSIEFNCIDEIATIVALLNCDSIFLNYNFYEDLNAINEEILSSNKDGRREARNNNKKKRKKKKNDDVDDEDNDEEHKKNIENGKKKKRENSDFVKEKKGNSEDENDDRIDTNIDELKIRDKNKLINAARRKLIHPDGDHLTLLHIFYLWQEEESVNQKKYFCHLYALNNEILQQVEKIKIQLLEIIKNKLGVEIPKKLHMHKWEQVLICLCKSCFFHVARSTSNTNVFINLVNKSKIRIHPSSTLFNSIIKPSFIVYSDIVQTKRLYARIVTRIEADWLLKHVSKNFQLMKT
ncbi:ATP-dependent RNA helicase prh1, putative [Plasmodium malariae]|uniref:ATP-dependent RNA helicase prh1, putative n=1 Tax=Plasmodium malariae TaxID=5858 RepID=A0A1A8VQQ2_PLAMA|nr:ATP-dependent RNA helicase prh1, putative [Plasmodium malariae]